MLSVDLMSLWAFVCSVHLCSSVRKNMSFFFCHYVIMSSKPYPVSLCHYVILSKKIHLSRPVSLLFCLQNHLFCYLCPPVTLSSKLPCLPLSLCHYVLKTTSVSPRPPVILSSKTTLSDYLYYYIYPACDRLFCVVPLHRHQE